MSQPTKGNDDQSMIHSDVWKYIYMKWRHLYFLMPDADWSMELNDSAYTLLVIKIGQ